jgi:hypothetical protein
VVAARAFIVVATLASFLAVAASRVETLSCVLPMSATSDARLEEVAVTVVWRLAHESLRSAHRANTIVELAVKGRQSCIGLAGVLHESLSPNVGVDGLLQVEEVGNSCPEQFHHSWANGAFVPGIRACKQGDAKLEIDIILITVIGRVASTSGTCRNHVIGRGGVMHPPGECGAAMPSVGASTNNI